MLDIKRIRENLEEIKTLISVRNSSYAKKIDKISDLDQQWREALTENQKLEAQRNRISKNIGFFLQKKEVTEFEKSKKQVIILKAEIEKNNQKIAKLEKEINNLLLTIPNLPHTSVVQGVDEKDNPEIRKWGEIKISENLPHWDIAEKFNLVDFAKATKLSGSRFILYCNQGAKLIRALFNFMLDEHAKKGYIEHLPPLIVNENVLVGTGQLPKFVFDQFKIEDREQYLIPTAEAPLTNLFREEIVDINKLPLKMCAYTPCFRLEAGSAGKDTRGVIRVHQFNKVELVQIVKPEDSFNVLEQLTNDAENILQKLNIPYRVISLCSGDLGFSAAKTYDLEIWMPGQQTYREVSSCSNCTDFQSRRMNLRAVSEESEEKVIPHTLNGSGVAVDRVFAAILENFYNSETEEILIPEVLQPYMQGMKKITL